MRITNEVVKQMGNLAYLELDEKQEQTLKDHMENMLLQVEALKEIDTEGIEPLVYIHDCVNVTRPDEVEASLKREILLENAVGHTEEGFVVPKILG